MGSPHWARRRPAGSNKNKKKEGVGAALDALVIYAPYKEGGNISVALGRALNLKLKNSRSLLIKAINRVATIRIIFYGTPQGGGGLGSAGPTGRIYSHCGPGLAALLPPPKKNFFRKF